MHVRRCDRRGCGKWSVDLIVIGCHGRKGIRRAMGSHAEYVVRTTPVPARAWIGV
ncbi:MAG: universal stress protein [Steroidobacteraceae bacterium]